MKKTLLLFLILYASVLHSQKTTQSSILNKKTPNSFIKNHGQIIDQDGKSNTKVLYLLNTSGLNVQFRKSGFSYDVYEQKPSLRSNKKNLHTFPNQLPPLGFNPDTTATALSFHRVDIDFLNINKNVHIEEWGLSKAYTNYYTVPQCEEGITKVESFKRIVYKNVYNGIDLEFFVSAESDKPVEYNFIVNPGAEISQIKMKISGAPVVLKNNELNLKLIHGNLKETIPKSWIKTDNKEKEVRVSYKQLAANIFGFNLAGSNISNSSTLIIDPTPVRQWATYFGGESRDSQERGGV
ncbi:MAG: hypothetical protein CL868_13345, partial [Cytophagaceae bacterium]|nr:hypothetical protein [Cytophagaceae bacterium]